MNKEIVTANSAIKLSNKKELMILIIHITNMNESQNIYAQLEDKKTKKHTYYMIPFIYI